MRLGYRLLPARPIIDLGRTKYDFLEVEIGVRGLGRHPLMPTIGLC